MFVFCYATKILEEDGFLLKGGDMGVGVELMIVAGGFIALSNYCMRKSIDAGGSTKAYLMIQLFITFLVSILLNPVRAGDFTWSPSMASFGFSGGLILALMMLCLGRALETGPSSLTFAMLNSSTVMPILLMVLLFGKGFGFMYNSFNAIGSLLVVLGLFWAGWETVRMASARKWLAFASAAFVLHVVFLVFMQWRALFIHFPGEKGLLLSFDSLAAKSHWFMPMVFLAAFLVQFIVYLFSSGKKPTKAEMQYGIIGGVANGVGTFCMICSTEKSSSFELAMIFPVFAITTLFICNMWGQWLYKEKVNWKANAFCMAGVFIGTVDWGSLIKG